MTEVELKEAAIAKGLQVGQAVDVYDVTVSYDGKYIKKKVDTGMVTALFPHIFVIEKEKDGIKECYQYKQFMLHEVEIRQKEKGKR